MCCKIDTFQHFQPLSVDAEETQSVGKVAWYSLQTIKFSHLLFLSFFIFPFFEIFYFSI